MVLISVLDSVEEEVVRGPSERGCRCPPPEVELELSEVDKSVPEECCEARWAVRRVSESVTKVQ